MIAWQNALMSIRQKNGKPHSPTHLKSIHSRLSAIFNYAVKCLKQNPAEISGNMGKETHREMLFWTKEEYLKSLYGLRPTDRLFPITKSYLHCEMGRGSKAAGVKRTI